MYDAPSDALAAELEWAARGAAAEIEELRQRVADLQRACDDRGGVIADLRSALEGARDVANQRAEAVAALEAALTAARARAESAEAERTAHDERLAILRREAIAEVAAARADADLLRAREGESVIASRAVIDELQRVCDERMALIERLTGETDAVRRDAEAMRRNMDLARARQGEELLAARALSNELQQACDERLALIEQLTAEIHLLRERVARAEADAAAQRATTQQLTLDSERRTVLLADLTAAFEDKVREVEHLRGALPRTS
jgi:hypothetical protein